MDVAAALWDQGVPGGTGGGLWRDAGANGSSRTAGADGEGAAKAESAGH